MFGERGRSEFGAGKYVLIAFALIALEFVLCRFLLSRVFLDTQSNCALQCIAFAMKNQLTQTRMLHLIQTPKKCKNAKMQKKRNETPFTQYSPKPQRNVPSLIQPSVSETDAPQY
jgi:hypothetical protein